MTGVLMPDLAGPKIAYLGYCGLIDSAGVTRIAGALNTCVNGQYDRAYLCLSSNGGYVGDGLYLYNHIRSLPIPVTIHNTGTVASIAATLFVAGERRLSTQHSIFMMHPVQVGANGSMASAPLQAALDSALKDEARTENIVRERTGIPEDVLLARRTKDIYLTAQQALTYDLIHEIGDFVLPAGNQIFQV